MTLGRLGALPFVTTLGWPLILPALLTTLLTALLVVVLPGIVALWRRRLSIVWPALGRITRWLLLLLLAVWRAMSLRLNVRAAL